MGNTTRTRTNGNITIDIAPEKIREGTRADHCLVPTFNPMTGRFEMSKPRIGYSINRQNIGEIIYHAGDGEGLPPPYVDGTLESSAAPLYGKKILVAGLGSFGARIAVELAAAGVSHFEMWDADTVEAQNLSRHVAGVSDVGARKVDVVKREIREKNPAATVVGHFSEVQSDPVLFENAVRSCDVIAACTDNNQSRFFIDDVARACGKTVVYSRAYVRAEGGDIFISRPGEVSYPEYLRQIAGVNEIVATEKQGRRRGDIPAYASEKDVDVIVQPGLSLDILPILHFHAKLLLMSAAHGTASELRSFEEEIGDANFFLWASVRRDGNPFGTSFQRFASGDGTRPTCFRWYPMHLDPIGVHASRR